MLNRTRLTNVDWLDANALLDVGSLSIVSSLMREDLGFTKRVDKSGATSTRSACIRVVENAKKGEGTAEHNEGSRAAPTTMTVNWTPFLTLFPRRLA